MVFSIDYWEIYGGDFEIEAESEEEAKEKFFEEFDYYSRKLDCQDSDMIIEPIDFDQEFWAPSDDRQKYHPEYPWEQQEIDPAVFDIDSFF